MSDIEQVVPTTKSASAYDAKQTLKKFVSRIDKHLANYFEGEIKNAFGVSKKEKKLSKQIWEHIKEHNLRPAKRIRGSFIYYGYKLLGGENDTAIVDAAMSIELIHTALLIHDDIMDQDDTRRGLPTTHKHFSTVHKRNRHRFDPNHFGNSMAINTGDIALLAGYQLLGKSNFPEKLRIRALNQTLRGIINTGIGQAYDVTLEALGKATEQDIIDLHYAKTGIYTYENPLHIGALLAGAKESDLKVISEYAMPGGIAFQLQDDILGLFGNPEKTGKPAHSDLRQGKITLLIIKAIENATRKQFVQLNRYWGNRDLTESGANIVREIVRETGSLEYSKKISIKWAKKAQDAIAMMRKNAWNKEAIDYLDGITQYMIEREV